MCNFSTISWGEQVKFWWYDDDARFVLDQHAELDFCSTRSMKQQSACGHVAPIEHIILIQSQTALVYSHSLMMRAYLRNSKYQFHSVWFDPFGGSNPLSTALDHANNYIVVVYLLKVKVNNNNRTIHDLNLYEMFVPINSSCWTLNN